MAKYSTEFKKKIVAEYLKGNIGYGSLAKKYNIPSMNPIATWLLLFRVLVQKEFLVLAKRKVILFNLSCMR